MTLMTHFAYLREESCILKDSIKQYFKRACFVRLHGVYEGTIAFMVRARVDFRGPAKREFYSGRFGVQ